MPKPCSVRILLKFHHEEFLEVFGITLRLIDFYDGDYGLQAFFEVVLVVDGPSKKKVEILLFRKISTPVAKHRFRLKLTSFDHYFCSDFSALVMCGFSSTNSFTRPLLAWSSRASLMYQRLSNGLVLDSPVNSIFL